MDARNAVPHAVVNALTIDVEDYFHVSAFAPYVERSTWDSRTHRIERNVNIILAILDLANTRATFFTLGWIAERYPQLVRQIVAQGHELASHGYAHERVNELKPAVFSADVVLAKAILEDVAGIAISGYRAPSFSIGTANRWAYDCLAEAGYRYSSSTYPIAHDHYGERDGLRFTYDVGGGMLEVPVTTARFLRRNWPAGGGGYFRLMPYAVSRWLIERVNSNDRKAAIFYFHPWEIDPEQPRITGVGAKTRFRHYLNLQHTSTRLRKLLRDFRWARMDRVVLGES